MASYVELLVSLVLFKYINAQLWLKQKYLLVHERAYLYVCVLHQVVLKVRAEPQGDV